jgi:hypothetical protein
VAKEFLETRLANVAVYCLVLTGILLGGALVAVGGFFAGFLFAGALVAVSLVLVPAHIGLWLLFFVVLLVVGPVTYFAGMQKAFWVPFLMSTLLMAKVPLELLRFGSLDVPYSRRTPAFLGALYLFLGLFLLSAALNDTSALTLLVASKNYVFVWSIMFLIGLGAVAEGSLENLWRFFLWVGVVQLPLAAVERTIFAPRRSGILNWDAVVGTFGGDPDGGGASAAMALYLVFTMLLASSMYSAKRISGVFHWTILACAIGAIALAEVKVVFILLPLGYLWLFRKQIPHHLGLTFVMGAVLSTVLAGVFVIYATTLYRTELGHSSVAESIERVAEFESRLYSYERLTGQVSRMAALVKWWELNPIAEPAQFLFGHGPGASRVSETAGIGAAARKYPFTLSTSTASVLLWDVGLCGYVSFLLIVLSGAHRAERTARNAAIPEVQRCILRTNAAGLLLVAMMTIHNRDAIDFAAVQFFIAVVLGHLLFMARKYDRRPRGFASEAGAGLRISSTAAALGR